MRNCFIHELNLNFKMTVERLNRRSYFLSLVFITKITYLVYTCKDSTCFRVWASPQLRLVRERNQEY